MRISLQDKLNTQADTLVGTTAFKDICEGIDKLISFENVYLGITIIEIVTGKEILFGTPNDFNDLVNAISKEWRTAGEESVWYNPATWKLFDFIGDIQAQAFGIDRDEPPPWEKKVEPGLQP